LRKHEPKICIMCGKEYTPTSGPQKFCLNCKPPRCEGCDRIELAIEVERKRTAKLTYNTRKFLTLVPCISRTIYTDHCVKCETVCEWYKTMVIVAEAIKEGEETN